MHTERDPDRERRGNVASSTNDSDISGGPPSGSTGGHTSLTPREEATIQRAHAVGRLLDEAVTVPGTNYRVGLDPILGILPIAGDGVATVVALYPILEAARHRLPAWTVARMLTIVAIDSVIGSVPILGTVFDAVWKANKWNARTLERHLRGEHGR